MRDSNKLLTHERYMKMKNWYAKIFLIWTTSNYFWALEVWKIWGFQIKVVELPFYKLASNWNSENVFMQALIFILQIFKLLWFSKILSFKSWLNRSLFSQSNKFLPWKISFLIFCGLYVKTTCLYLPNKMFDPLDPWGHPQGVPWFQLQYIKLNTPSYIAILILFTYMVVNGV